MKIEWGIYVGILIVVAACWAVSELYERKLRLELKHLRHRQKPRAATLHLMKKKKDIDLSTEIKAFNKAWEDYLKVASALGGPTLAGELLDEHGEPASTIYGPPNPKSEHPAAEFDRMTAQGYKLNLLTGEYYK